MEDEHRNIQEENQTKERYIKIDYDILFDKNLSTTAKHLFPIIELLDNDETGCFASNEYLGAFMNCSPNNISKSVSELRREGYIRTLVLDGKLRIIKVVDDGRRKKKIDEEIKKQKKRLKIYLNKINKVKQASMNVNRLLEPDYREP